MNNTRKISGKLCLLNSITLLVLLLVTCCRQPYRVINPGDAKVIYFGAIEPSEITFCPIKNIADLMAYDTYRDTLVYDTVIIHKYISMLNKLPLKKEGNIDIRFFTCITMGDGIQHIICYGYDSGILYDGAYVEDNTELLFFLDSIIYANHDMEYWAPAFFKEEVEEGAIPKPKNWNKKRGVRKELFK